MEASTIIGLVSLALVVGGLVFAGGKIAQVITFVQTAVIEIRAEFRAAAKETRDRIEVVAVKAEERVEETASKTEQVLDRILTRLDDGEHMLQRHDITIFGAVEDDPASLQASNAELRKIALHEHAGLLTKQAFQIDILERGFKRAIEDQTVVSSRIAAALEKLGA